MNLKLILTDSLHHSQFRLLQDIRYEAHLQIESLKNILVPSRRRERRKLEKMTDIKLHFGCGSKKRAGWLNIDGWDSQATDYVCDLRRPLPLKPNSVSLIFTEHVLEHFSYPEGAVILKDFCRILNPTGTVRIIVPDLEIFAERYLERDEEFLRDEWTNCASCGEVMNYVFYGHFHKTMYDYEMMRSQLSAAGFTDIRKCKFRDSTVLELNMDSDAPSRAPLSLCVEARK